LKGRRPSLFPVGHRTKAEKEARKGPGYNVAIGSKPPAHFNTHARAEWRRVIPELERLGVVKQVSIGSVVGLCSSYGAAMDAEAEVKKSGQILEEPIVAVKTGAVVGHRKVVNPAIRIARDSWALYKSYAAECCVTPASENKTLGLRDRPSVDELEIALCG
jgi:P27 family predicted phage terminase small subunit